MYCSIDDWINLSMEQIRAFEDDTQKELKMLQTSDVEEPTRLETNDAITVNA
jgi:hypothetical protein